MADFNISVFDSIYVLEPSITYDNPNFTYDGLLSYDGYYVQVEEISNINISDSLSITENSNNLIPFYNVSASDLLNITETITVNVSGAQILLVSVSDYINISENLTNDGKMLVSVFDQVNITENITRTISVPSINLYDSVSVSENTTQTTTSFISKYEIITTSESVVVPIQSLEPSVFDIINIAGITTTVNPVILVIPVDHEKFIWGVKII
jgi:hypothetical protein